MNPADALIGLKSATVQIAGYTSRNATGFQICLGKLCHSGGSFDLVELAFFWRDAPGGTQTLRQNN